MPKTYIAKALTIISKWPNGNTACDQIGSSLGKKPAAEVRRIDSDLNFNLIEARGRNNELKDIRRAAVLVEKTLLPPAFPGKVTQADRWDEGKLRAFILGQLQSAQNPFGTGFYFKGSFWGYSNHREREWAKSSWEEAKTLLGAGILTMARVNTDTKSANITARWFGRDGWDVVRNNLETTRQAMDGRFVGLCYRGTGAGVANGYQESGVGQGPQKSNLSAEINDWAYSHETAHAIGLCVKFFDQNLVVAKRNSLHDISKTGMRPSRGGAMVHELTHQYAKTLDQEVPDETYEYLQKAAPGDGARAQGYGAYTCSALAKSAIMLTKTNADSYRLFCEDALINTSG